MESERQAKPDPDGITVLCVDDEELNNELVRRTLRRMPNATVLAATSGAQALQILASSQVHVVLVDQSMPVMSGVEVLERARAVAPRTIGIMVTGFPELKEVIRAQERGIATQVVVKPWAPSELLAALERAVKMLDMQGVARRLSKLQSQK